MAVLPFSPPPPPPLPHAAPPPPRAPVPSAPLVPLVPVQPAQSMQPVQPVQPVQPMQPVQSFQPMATAPSSSLLYPEGDVFDSLDLDEGGGGPSVEKALWLLVGLSAVFLTLRLYCKQRYPNSRLRWEDAVLVASWVMLVADASIVTFLIVSGFSSPGFAVTRANITTISVAGLASVTAGIAGQAWSKTSFAMTLLRMSQGWMAAFIWFAIVSMNVLFGASATLFWVGCSPVEKRWSPFVPGDCDPDTSVRAAVFGFYVSIYSGLVDIILALLPWPILLKLRASPNGLELSIKEKIGVALAMSMGVVAGAMAFVGASYFRVLEHPSIDLTDGSGDLASWAAAETAVAIMASSIPVLRVLIRDLAAREAARLQARLARRKAAIAKPIPIVNRRLWKDQVSLSSRPADLEPILLRKPGSKGDEDEDESGDEGRRRQTKGGTQERRIGWADSLAVDITRSPDSSYGPWSPRSPRSPHSPRRIGEVWRQ
ncbi:hypothetical protein RB593_010315 [Gaeumannomyces tritici]